MTIPDFQSLMLPLMKLFNDEKEHSTSDAINYLGKEFTLTEEEILRLLPSGTQSIFKNRVYWAVAHLKMAGLLENIRRGVYKITSEGLNLLQANPTKININKLREYPEYIENMPVFKKSSMKKNTEDKENSEEVLTPEENMEISYQKIKSLWLKIFYKK